MTDAGPAAWEDDTFTMRFAFFSRTDADVRLRVLEGRLSRLQERLDRAQHSGRGGAGDDRYLSELRRHSIESVEREVAWLTDLITAERAGERPAELPGDDVRSRDRGGPEPQRHQHHHHERGPAGRRHHRKHPLGRNRPTWVRYE